jgi:ribonuclease-3
MAGETKRQRLRALLRRVGISGVDLAALEPAFVHASAVHEGHAEASYERLEFLGDAVLGAIVARWLFERYPDASEGELSLRKASLISDLALASTAERLEFGALLVAGSGLRGASQRASVLADAFEAFVGALYLQIGIEKVARFIERSHLAEREKNVASLDDPKTVLQEWTQRRYAHIPSYRERVEGPAHARVFEAEVSIEDEKIASGSGPSKKLAQRAAAERALEVLRERYGDLESRKLSQPGGARRAAKRAARARP